MVGRPITSKGVDAHRRSDAAGNALPPEAWRREAMGFVTLEDETALIETVWVPGTWRRYGPLLYSAGTLVVHGRVDAPFGCVSVQVERVETL